MKRILFLFIFVSCSLFSRAQVDLDYFSGIKSQGSIPQDLRLTLNELYEQDKQRARDFNDGKLKNRDKVLLSSFFINKLTASGRVLFGDPLTKMLEGIADRLLVDYPDLRKSIRIYTLKSPEVNAFMTGQGMLFVTTGLLAQVENEAQLAFILGHEAIHYYKNHNWESLTSKKEKKYSEKDQLRDFVRYHNRSREMENEADSLCLELFFLGSPYSKNTIDGVFDVLQYGYLPFDEMEIDSTFFDTKYYHFNKDYFLDKVAPITSRDDYDDSKSTHPNIFKRRMACERIKGARQDGSLFVTVSKEQFENLRDLARMECIRQDLIYAEYPRAYYNSQVMLQYMPNNEYLTKAKAEALYGLSKFRWQQGFQDVWGDYKTKEGEMQQAYHFLRKVSSSELNLMAIRELWSVHKRFPSDTNITLMTEDAMKEFARQVNVQKYDFKAVFDTSNLPQDTVVHAKSKYDKIKQKRKNENVEERLNYFFTDMMETDQELKPYMENCFRHAKDSVVAPESKGRNMFIYAAEYYVLNGDDCLKAFESDNRENSLRDYLGEVAKKEKMGVVDFSDQGLRSLTTDVQYNDFVALNEWVGEFWQSQGKFGRQLTSQSMMNDLVMRYDADRINLTQVLNFENVKGANAFVGLLASALVPFILPVTIANCATGYEHTYIESLYANTATGNVINSGSYSYGSADDKAVVKGAIYDNIEKSKGNKKATYLGRHFMVGADLLLGVNQIEDHEGLFSLSADDHREVMFQARPRLNVEYLINQDFSLMAAASVSKTKTRESYFISSTYYGDVYYDLKTTLQNKDIYTYSFGFRKYNQIAPQGTFWGMSAQLHASCLDTLNNPHVLDNDDKVNLYTAGLNFEFGRNYVLYDFLVLNIGMNIGLVGGLPFTMNESSIYNHDQRWYNNRYFAQRLWLQNVFMFNVGLKILPL